MRPSDWRPLASSDPVPGDPAQITVIARRHADLAAELANQATNLRTLASSEGWDTDAGRLFAGSAAQVAEQLDGARRRYTAVAEALSGYSPYLEQAQREADAALAQAKTAQATIGSGQPPVPPTFDAGSGEPLGDEDRTEAARRARDVEYATDDLRLARQRLHHAEDLRTTQARRAANHIGDVTAGELVDSWWDKVKDWTSDQWDGLMAWTHEHADLLRKIADVCGWIATALAVVAIILSFTPLAPLAPFVAGAGMVFTGLALGCHLLLVASGDGSWVDVGFDIIGLVTAGYGGATLKGVQAGRKALQVTATRAARTAAKKAAKQALRTAGKAIPKPGTRAAQVAARAVRKQVSAAARGAVEEAKDIPRSTFLKYALTLDGHAAHALAEAKSFAKLASSPRFVAKAAEVKALAVKGGVSRWLERISDGIDKSGALDPEEPDHCLLRYSR